MHCILICFINTPRYQIIHHCIDVSRHSSEHINRLLTISYGKHCFNFQTNQLSTRFFGTNYVHHPSFNSIYTYKKSLKKLSKNKMLNTVNTDYSKHLKLHIFPHDVTPFFTHTIDDNDSQTGVVDCWAW